MIKKGLKIVIFFQNYIVPGRKQAIFEIQIIIDQILAFLQ